MPAYEMRISDWSSDVCSSDLTYADFVNRQMRDAESEVARIAAGRLIDGNLKLAKPYADVETTAKHSLKSARIIRSVGQPSSRLNEILAYILKRKKTPYDVNEFFDDSCGTSVE